MGHEDCRQACGPRLGKDQLARLLAQGHVEFGKRLVEQQQARLGEKHALERDTRLLPARKRLRVAVEEPAKPAFIERVFCHPTPDVSVLERLGYGKDDVAADRKMREQQRILEENAGVALLRPQRDQIVLPEQNCTAGGKGRVEKSADIGEQRRLAGARRTHDRQDVAGHDRRRNGKQQPVGQPDRHIGQSQRHRLAWRSHSYPHCPSVAE
ncbi:hypothetical protein BKP54_28950 [Ensifer sp. 1H6]|nr:hypothetical protein BKP54_28950 [Ensifer sp. 1H6]